jgi:putative FmdB family regulatory protein
MAQYEFDCSNCGNNYTVIDPKNRPEKKQACQDCGEMNSKIMSAPTAILRPGGCGWSKDGYAARRSMSDGPEPTTGDRHKRSGKMVVPVRGMKLEPDKSTAKKKKPMLKVKK